MDSLSFDIWYNIIKFIYNPQWIYISNSLKIKGVDRNSVSKFIFINKKCYIIFKKSQSILKKNYTMNFTKNTILNGICFYCYLL